HAPVRAVVGLSHLIAWAYPYRWVEPLWVKKRKGSASFAFVYVGGWLAILLAVLLSGVAKNPHGWEWAFVGVAIYRLVNILNFYVGLFLDRTQGHLRSVE